MIAIGATLPFGLTSRFFDTHTRNSSNATIISKIENEIILHGRRNNRAWFGPEIGVIPGNEKNVPTVIIKAYILTGNDVGIHFYLKTNDLGKTWSNPVLCQNWHKIPLGDDIFETASFGFLYHKMTNKLIGIGRTGFEQDMGYANYSPLQKGKALIWPSELKRSVAYTLWNPIKEDFEPWVKMKLPENHNLTVSSNSQFHENDDGTILIPGYYPSPPGEEENNKYTKVTVLRFRFNGTELQYIEHGTIHSMNEARGLAEPSLVYYNGKYYMTIRHDLRAYVTSSEDGLHFKEIKAWRFDNGEELGNYNTQQKWLKHNDTLYLVYNRKSELNNGVFRGRAPLFIAEVDTEKLLVRRKTERVVFPEKGARMGNFDIANVADNESWVVTGEWLEGIFSHSKKSDRFWVDWHDANYNQFIGDLLLARVFWNKV